MRNIFIINPCAGQGKNIEKLEATIKEKSEKLNMSAEIYLTKSVGDAETFTRHILENTHGDERVRFFACGGDGTLNEVANGAFGYDNAQVGVVPIGTGNDYVRNYGSGKQFLDIEAQLTADAIPVDLIQYSGIIDGRQQTRCCVNMFNIGFDCNVVDKTAEMKNKPFVSGSLAYLLSVLAILIKKKGANLSITVDGENIHNGPNLLCAVANGSYCGGGIYSSPQANTDDGYMDVNVILNISRTKFLTLFPSYTKGTHFERKNIDKIITAYPCKEAVIEPLDGTMRLCTDGEISTTETITMKVINKCFNFVVPEK